MAPDPANARLVLLDVGFHAPLLPFSSYIRPWLTASSIGYILVIRRAYLACFLNANKSANVPRGQPCLRKS